MFQELIINILHLWSYCTALQQENKMREEFILIGELSHLIRKIIFLQKSGYIFLMFLMSHIEEKSNICPLQFCWCHLRKNALISYYQAICGKK